MLKKTNSLFNIMDVLLQDCEFENKEKLIKYWRYTRTMLAWTQMSAPENGSQKLNTKYEEFMLDHFTGYSDGIEKSNSKSITNISENDESNQTTVENVIVSRESDMERTPYDPCTPNHPPSFTFLVPKFTVQKYKKYAKKACDLFRELFDVDSASTYLHILKDARGIRVRVEVCWNWRRYQKKLLKFQ